MKRSYKNEKTASTKIDKISLYTVLRSIAVLKNGRVVEVEFRNKKEICEKIADIIGGKERDRLINCLMDTTTGSFLYNFIYYRDKDCWSYTAGQHYPSEIRAIRKEILK